MLVPGEGWRRLESLRHQMSTVVCLLPTVFSCWFPIVRKVTCEPRRYR